jgi:ectoine hydroxylase-related dioxygenase (phytanoyl-CoA dioxygenase family)
MQPSTPERTESANKRIWNAPQKLTIADPALFVLYYANDILALVSYAWLGPLYQVTSSIYVVNSGGQAQNPPRLPRIYVDRDGGAVPRPHPPPLTCLTL